MTRQRTVVVLGGGIGGIVAARILRKRVPEDVRVVLVDRDRTHTFTPSLLWLMSGDRTVPRITRDRRRLARKGIELLVGETEGLDPTRRTVRVDGADISYERLVLALGAQPAPELTPGLVAGGIDIYSADGALAAGRALRTIERGTVAILVAGLPYKCPAAPSEAAFLVEALLRRRGARVRVALYTPEPFPMPTAGEALGRTLAGMLQARGIALRTQHAVQEVDTVGRQLHFENGVRADYDLLLAIAHHRTTRAVRESGLVNDSGFVPTDPSTLSTWDKGTYAIGDVTQIPIAGGRFLPKAGVFAKTQARTVACRIADELRGREPIDTFSGEGSCFVDMGGGVAAFATGAFYAEGAPSVSLRRPSRRWHLAKVALEKYWLARWA